MTRGEVKEKLDALLEILPDDKAELLLGFAAFLRQQAEGQQPPAPREDWTDSERAIIAAEEYWFGLPEETRRSYGSQMVAVIQGQILDTDRDRQALRRRVFAKYPDMMVLYIEADAEPMPSLIIRSPRFR